MQVGAVVRGYRTVLWSNAIFCFGLQSRRSSREGRFITIAVRRDQDKATLAYRLSNPTEKARKRRKGIFLRSVNRIIRLDCMGRMRRMNKSNQSGLVFKGYELYLAEVVETLFRTQENVPKTR